MDLISYPPKFDLRDSRWPIYARSPKMPAQFVGSVAEIQRSSITEGCEIYGTVRHSVIFAGVTIEEGAVVEESVIMPNTVVRRGAIIKRAIVAENCEIGPGALVGATEAESGEIALVGQNTHVPAEYVITAGEQIDTDVIEAREARKA